MGKPFLIAPHPSLPHLRGNPVPQSDIRSSRTRQRVRRQDITPRNIQAADNRFKYRQRPGGLETVDPMIHGIAPLEAGRFPVLTGARYGLFSSKRIAPDQRRSIACRYRVDGPSGDARRYGFQRGWRKELFFECRFKGLGLRLSGLRLRPGEMKIHL